MLVVTNLQKIYMSGLLRRRKTIAVEGVTFSIAEGEIVSLVGESGSGKTTTALMVLRLLRPTAGKIEFMGQDIWKISNSEEVKRYWQKVHGIFQDPYAAFNPLYKADRILYQALDLTPNKDNNRLTAIREALHAVGLRPEDVLGKYPHQLSGGQKQRLMIARCYLLKPKLIVADEPVSMIDASSRAGILKLLLALRERYATAILFITHDLGLAHYVSDRILVMHKGKIVEEGRPEDIINNPQHTYTKKLISDIPLIMKKWDEFADFHLKTEG